MSDHKPYYNHVKIDESFCRKVREIRKNSGMSMKSFGLLIGTSSSTLCRIEKGQTSYISIGTLRNLEKYCGCSLKPIPETKYPELKARINELEKEVKMLRDYIREMWEKEDSLIEEEAAAIDLKDPCDTCECLSEGICTNYHSMHCFSYTRYLRRKGETKNE